METYTQHVEMKVVRNRCAILGNYVRTILQPQELLLQQVMQDYLGLLATELPSPQPSLLGLPAHFHHQRMIRSPKQQQPGLVVTDALYGESPSSPIVRPALSVDRMQTPQDCVPQVVRQQLP